MDPVDKGDCCKSLLGRTDLYFSGAMCKTVVICIYTYSNLNAGFWLWGVFVLMDLKHRKVTLESSVIIC